MIMKKIPVLMLLIVLAACAGGAATNGSANIASTPETASIAAVTASITDIQDRDWFLAELRRGSETIRIDRTRPGAEDVYTIRFEAERLSGTGAPNRHFGPYTSGEGNALSIRMVASSMMAALFENEDLR